MNRKPKIKRTWTYGRAFILTLGIFFFSLVFVVWFAQGDNSNEWPLIARCFLGAMTIGGVTFCWYAILGHDSSISRTIKYCGKHEGEVIIALLAGPIYWIGILFKKNGN